MLLLGESAAKEMADQVGRAFNLPETRERS